MATFSRIPLTVEAVLWDGDFATVKELAHAGVNVTVEHVVLLSLPDGRQIRVAVGQYLVLGPAGDVSCVDASEFVAEFVAKG